MTMGQRIAEQRKRLGLSLEALGEKLEVSRQAVSKWEADGAVPGIDKLIAMSKLFGVSVGWLLGVEEQPEVQEEALSEKQMEMIEQIIRKYQTPAQPKRRAGWIAVLISAAALIFALAAISQMDSNDANYDTQFQNLSNNYSSLQNQLGEVSQQLEEIANAEQLLTDYQVSAVVSEDRKGADITFNGAPKQWREGDTANLCVLYEEQEVCREVCQWDGIYYTAKVTLPARNGYTYHYIIDHGDGSQEQQPLTYAYHYASYVTDGLYINGNASFSTEATVDSLTLSYASVYLEIPPLYLQKEPLVWTELEAVVYKNGQELLRQDLFADWKEEPEYTGVSNAGLMAELSIESIPVTDGDVITAWIEAKAGEDLQIKHKAYTYKRQGDSYQEENNVEIYMR